MLKGIDISKWQGEVEFQTLEPQVDFVIIRSSYGNGYTDSFYQRNRDEATKLNIPKGFYHYAYPNHNSPEAEADWFLKVIGTPDKDDILVLDFEEEYPNPVDWCLRFLNRVSEKLAGYKPLLYINLDLNNRFDWSPVVAGDYGLWLARWDYDPEAMPPDTDWEICALRQYSNSENYNGINGRVDGNVFYGDLPTFKAYGYKQSVPPTVPPPDVEKLPKTSVIGDFYEVLTGKRPHQDTIDWRMSQGKNLVEIGTDICENDSEFKEKWIPEPTTPPVCPEPPSKQPVSLEAATGVVKESLASKPFLVKLSFILNLLS